MTSESSILPDTLVEDVRGAKNMLILDCRPQTDFARSHIKGAISVFLPSLMLRRLKAGKLNLSCIIQNNEAKDKFNRSWKTHPVVLYDESKAEPSPTSVVGLLAKKFKQEGSSPLSLIGKAPVPKISKNLGNTQWNWQNFFVLCSPCHRTSNSTIMGERGVWMTYHR